jgi:hypothetical protein
MRIPRIGIRIWVWLAVALRRGAEWMLARAGPASTVTGEDAGLQSDGPPEHWLALIRAAAPGFSLGRAPIRLPVRRGPRGTTENRGATEGELRAESAAEAGVELFGALPSSAPAIQSDPEAPGADADARAPSAGEVRGRDRAEAGGRRGADAPPGASPARPPRPPEAAAASKPQSRAPSPRPTGTRGVRVAPSFRPPPPNRSRPQTPITRPQAAIKRERGDPIPLVVPDEHDSSEDDRPVLPVPTTWSAFDQVPPAREPPGLGEPGGGHSSPELPGLLEHGRSTGPAGHAPGVAAAARSKPVRATIDADESDPWPELPGLEWPQWHDDLTTLLREELRRQRLRAEQAGSSWSAPPF